MFKRTLIMSLTIAIAALTLASCGAKKGVIKLDAEDSYARGKEFFEHKKYVDAMEDFKNVVYNFAGTRIASEASYYLAECYFLTKDFEAAIEEYQHLVSDYPSSSYADAAQYKVALCYFKESPIYSRDQSQYCDKAVAELEVFFQRYPDSPYKQKAEDLLGQVQDKLAHKDFDAARVYFKSKYYKAARIYLDGIIKTYPATTWAGQARQLLDTIYKLAPPRTASDSLQISPSAGDSARGK